MTVTIDTYDLTNPLKPTITKDDKAVLDYTIDWTAWLADAEDTISSIDVTIGDNGCTDNILTVNSSTFTNGKVTAFLAGGTLQQTYQVEYEIVTTGGRTDERSIYVKIRDR